MDLSEQESTESPTGPEHNDAPMAEQDRSANSAMATCRVFISYSHDSTEHEQRVRCLADQLRADGVDARIDQYVQDPDEGWIKWMRTQVKEAEKVLLVFTETYQRRFEGDEEQGKGLGVTFEGVMVTQSLYESGGRNAKFRPVVFRDEDTQFIPIELRSFNRYRVDTPEHYQNLLRWLYEAPRIIPPTLGQKMHLPPAPGYRLFPSFDKSLHEKGDESVCGNEASKGAIQWEDHLGHTYQGEPPAIICQAIQLSGTNISGKPIRIEAARLTSKISMESVEVDIGTVDGWMRPEQVHSIRPKSKVTLRARFNPPKGLTAQEFINSWGQCAFLLKYNAVKEEIPISEEMTRALYENFEPEVIAPRPIQKAPSRMRWSRDGTIARSSKGHGYYRIAKQYVPEPGVEEERYLGWYQAGGHALDPNGSFTHISGPIHGYKTVQEAQRACEEDDATLSQHLGL